jgi:hypothetical protein
MGDSITNWITAIAAVLSLLAFLRLIGKQTKIMEGQAEIQRRQTNIAEQQAEISRQQLALIQKQDYERQNNLKKANLSYQLISNKEKHGPYQYLIIKNAGPSEARNIEVRLGGKTLKECRSLCIQSPEKIEELSPNTEFRYELNAGIGVVIPSQITLHWSDDFEENRSAEGSLSYT